MEDVSIVCLGRGLAHLLLEVLSALVVVLASICSIRLSIVDRISSGGGTTFSFFLPLVCFFQYE